MNHKTGREDITLEDMRAEIVRELVTRKRVFPRWIAEGKIAEDTAHYRMIVFEALVFHLHDEVKKNAKPDEIKGEKKMNNIGNKLAAIQEIAEELNFVSESDNQVNAYVGGRKIIWLNVESFKLANPQFEFEPVVEQNFIDVIEAQENLTQGWTALREYLENNLTVLRVYKTGTIQREVFIVGLFDNHIIGVRSFAIET